MSLEQSLPGEVRAQDKIIGLFVLVAMGLVLYLVLQQTYFQSERTNWIKLNSILSNTFGLSQGTLIELSGVTIGNVESVLLRPDAQVEVAMRINNEYAELLSADSTLKINRQLGLDTVLSGVRLELVPGQSEKKMLGDTYIEITEPKSFDDIIEEMKLEELAKQLQGIVRNVAELTSDLAEQREDLSVTLTNMREFSGQMVQAGALTPGVMSDANTTLMVLQDSLKKLDNSVATLTPPTSALMVSTRQVMVSALETLEALQPSLQQMPELLETTNETMLSINHLTLQLSRHWLLRDGKNGEETSLPKSRLPADNALYKNYEE